jgi:ABC transport system ATP-binding/permease protein
LASIVNAQRISKQFGINPLFQNLFFTVSENDRIGLIGPNGSGKSTLLEILCGRIKPDRGEVAIRKRAKLSYVAQISEFAPGETVRSVIEKALEAADVSPAEREARTSEALGRAGFTDFEARAATLSGGWRKRLRMAEGLVQRADILLLDEPTNHLDFAGIHWLETVLQNAPFACVVVSHDRYFLENVATEIVELSRAYPDGMFRVNGNYSRFLEKKEEFLQAEGRRQEALTNRVHTELEWLRRAPRARRTKAKARIDKAHELIGELADMNSRSRTAAARIDFSASDRQTKQLIRLENVACTLGDRRLFAGVTFSIQAGMRVGLVGQNGSGKTTLLRLLRGDIPPTRGEIVRADALRIVYFDQNRQLDPDLTLRRALAPDSDSVVYQDRVIHVASWAARFLFDSDDLGKLVGRLSGGERARVLIAQLMLQAADVLLLDEPTNDLDIPTLEILEESLLEYPGALVLVTHDRFMLDRVSSVVLGLDGLGAAERFGDYSQWEVWQRAQQAKAAPGVEPATATAAPASAAPAAAKKKLSYLEAREFGAIEQKLADAEQQLSSLRKALEDPAMVSDAARLHTTYVQMEEAQQHVQKLYLRWAELEEKQG